MNSTSLNLLIEQFHSWNTCIIAQASINHWDRWACAANHAAAAAKWIGQQKWHFLLPAQKFYQENCILGLSNWIMPLDGHLLNITLFFLKIIKLQVIIFHSTGKLCVDVGWFAVTATRGFSRLDHLLSRTATQYPPVKGKYLHVLEWGSHSEQNNRAVYKRREKLKCLRSSNYPHLWMQVAPLTDHLPAPEKSYFCLIWLLLSWLSKEREDKKCHSLKVHLWNHLNWSLTYPCPLHYKGLRQASDKTH